MSFNRHTLAMVSRETQHHTEESKTLQKSKITSKYTFLKWWGHTFCF